MVPGLGDCGANQTADEGMGRAGGNAVAPGDQIPDDRRQKRAEDNSLGDDFGGDNTLADGACDMGAEKGAADIKKPASRIAARAVSTLVETTVAIELAES